MTVNFKRCCKCQNDIEISGFHKCKSKKDGLQTRCKDCARLTKSEWVAKNKDKVRSYNNEWHRSNPEKAARKAKKWIESGGREWHREYARNKRLDPVHCIRNRIQCRVRGAINGAKYSNNESTRKHLGCTYDELREHIESKFYGGMSWDNKDLWHIDHIIPLASAKTKDDLFRLFHYTNLQPLWAFDNRSKAAKILQTIEAIPS